LQNKGGTSAAFGPSDCAQGLSVQLGPGLWLCLFVEHPLCFSFRLDLCYDPWIGDMGL